MKVGEIKKLQKSNWEILDFKGARVEQKSGSFWVPFGTEVEILEIGKVQRRVSGRDVRNVKVKVGKKTGMVVSVQIA